MATHTERTISIHGTVCGPIWWPAGAKCGKPVSATLRRANPRDVSQIRRDIFDAINDDVLNDGDFQNCSLTADSVIEIRHVTLKTQDDGLIIERTDHSRIVEVSALPSLAQLVDTEAYSSDFE